MAGKLSLLVGFGAGYVLGARSGRERYDQIAGKAQEVWRDPRVQEKAGQAQQLVKEKASEASQAVKQGQRRGQRQRRSETSWTRPASTRSSTTTASAPRAAGSGSSGGTSS